MTPHPYLGIAGLVGSLVAFAFAGIYTPFLPAGAPGNSSSRIDNKPSALRRTRLSVPTSFSFAQWEAARRSGHTTVFAIGSPVWRHVLQGMLGLSQGLARHVALRGQDLAR